MCSSDLRDQPGKRALQLARADVDRELGGVPLAVDHYEQAPQVTFEPERALGNFLFALVRLAVDREVFHAAE